MGRGIFLRFLKRSHPAFPSQNQSTNQMNVLLVPLQGLTALCPLLLGFLFVL